jgi:hypothetical protein
MELKTNIYFRLLLGTIFRRLINTSIPFKLVLTISFLAILLTVNSFISADGPSIETFSWPLSPVTQPHPIGKTYGDWNAHHKYWTSKGAGFHSGVDLPGDIGDKFIV